MHAQPRGQFQHPRDALDVGTQKAAQVEFLDVLAMWASRVRDRIAAAQLALHRWDVFV
jgi:hypothetical protein